ncbi:MAG TPA: photosynthetic reaction center cytochrome c subunit family protein [Gemmatimonadaceae bacterium]|nr:photosynthetic reaction center cytochrome c subunit family protein [Gemmatimonadaceae bacterium]
MAAGRVLAMCGGILMIASCSHGSATPTPSPSGQGPTTASNPATGAPAGGTGGRRMPIPRDSLAKLRAVYVARVMQQIAGRETQPAEQVFQNIQVLKGVPAGQLVRMMDTVYGRSMSWNCTNCHRLAPQGNFASDTSPDKRRARFMQQMTSDINLVQLPKLYPKDTPKVTCMTCHRGYNEPPNDQYMIPERGHPGGLPLPPARGQSGPPPSSARPPLR